MLNNIIQFFKKFKKSEKEESKSTAKERLHLVLAQDRANISADFLEMMKQEIIEVIKKYIDIDEKAIDVRLTNKEGEDGSIGAPALYANIPIITIKNDARKLEGTLHKEEKNENSKVEDKKTEIIDENAGNNKVKEENLLVNEVIETTEEKVDEIDKNVNISKNSTNEATNKTSNDDKENDNLNEDDNEKKNS